jgi:hypothetical protein
MSQSAERALRALKPYHEYILATIDELVAGDPRHLMKAESDALGQDVLRVAWQDIADGLSDVQPQTPENMQLFLRRRLTNAFPGSTESASAGQAALPRRA